MSGDANFRKMLMGPETNDRRFEQRCTKDVGMHCSFLHGKTEKVVTIRNFGFRGVYFESSWNMQPGNLIVLRAMDANDFVPGDAQSDAPRYTIDQADPKACMGYRSHSVAMVRRCEKLDRQEGHPLYGVGAEIQILTD
jgi:hypothetical protein